MKRRSVADAKGGLRLPTASSASHLHAVPEHDIVVQKFGGTSVGSLERIRAVAKRVVRDHRAGRAVVVVVSAMAGETNRLIALAKDVSPVPDRAELDVIAATGEQVAASLTALAIREEGVRARSFLGHQARVVTDGAHGDGRVLRVEAAAIRQCLERGEIPVLAGFQGVDAHGRVVTLGRGGSDTSAVVVAAALGAVCEIYTDVDGVYSADPSIVPGARRLTRCALDSMFILASNGAKVLHPRSVAVARAHGVTMYVRSSFLADDPGTLLTLGDESGELEAGEPLEGTSFAGLARDRSIALMQVTARSDAEAMRVIARLAAERIALSMVSRGAAPGIISFVIPEADVERVLERIDQTPGVIASANKDVASITLAGAGLSSPAVVARFLESVLAQSAECVALNVDDSKIQCVVDAGLSSVLLNALHTEFFPTPINTELLRCTA